MICSSQKAFCVAWATLKNGGRDADAANVAAVRKHQDLLQTLLDAPRRAGHDW